MVLDISGAVFCCFFYLSGVPKKSQMFGLAIAGRNGMSIEIHQILAEVDFFFWTECIFLSNYYGLDPFQGSVIL